MGSSLVTKNDEFSFKWGELESFTADTLFTEGHFDGLCICLKRNGDCLALSSKNVYFNYYTLYTT